MNEQQLTYFFNSDNVIVIKSVFSFVDSGKLNKEKMITKM